MTTIKMIDNDPITKAIFWKIPNKGLIISKKYNDDVFADILEEKEKELYEIENIEELYEEPTNKYIENLENANFVIEKSDLKGEQN